MQLGSIDLAFVTGMGLSTVLPEAGVLNIPFLFRDVGQAHAVMDGPVGESFRKLFAGKDMIMLAWGDNGIRHMTNSKHTIATPDDLKGLKIRVPQSEVLLKGFQTLGVDAASMPFPQLFEALRAGKFDGEENPIATIRAAKFDQVQKFLTLTAHAYDPAVFVMSPDGFDDLSAEDKKSFVEAAKLGGEASRKFAAAAESEGVTALRRAGMTVQIDIDRARFASAMAPAMAEFGRGSAGIVSSRSSRPDDMKIALSVRSRIFGGFAVVLVLLAALALVAHRGMVSVRSRRGSRQRRQFGGDGVDRRGAASERCACASGAVRAVGVIG